jgi:hypothetical protein
MTYFGEQKKRRFQMIQQFVDANIGTPVYINPAYVMSIRPDPTDPDHISQVQLRTGETLRVRGDHREVAATLTRAA